MADAPVGLAAALHDRYLLQRELGRGGMAVVYLAQDLKHDRPVALKVLLPELAASLGPERFQREIRLAARLQHPHVLTVHDSGEAAGQLWFTMPFVEGESLRDRLRRDHQLPVDDALRVAREAAQALQYAHEHGVVHRDIKPENILLTKDGSTLVADFGIARALGVGDQLTQTGLAVGTPAYMSPEQASGDKAVGPQSDIYSLACVLYETLAGEPPYTGPTAQLTIMKRFTDPVPSVRRSRPTAPEAVEQALQRALAPVPADRFATAADFGRALASNLTTPTAVPTVVPPALQQPAAATPAPTLPTKARRRIPLGIATLAIGFVLGLGVLFAWRRAHREPDEGVKHVAVLPFENEGDSADAYFADGITDELRGKLAAVPGLEVVAGRSSNEYRRTTKSLPEIARELGVEYVLVGKILWVKREGANRVRVSPELVRVTPGAAPTTKWQQPFDARLTDVFQVQADIAGKVAGALNVALGSATPRAVTRPTGSTEAYDYYLRANEYYDRQTIRDVQLALQLYRQAVGLDSAFALAWARLARAEAFVYWFGDKSSAQLEKVDQAARRALALAPDLPEAHVAMGYLHYWGHRDYTAALEEFAAAAKREPNNAEVAYVKGLVLRRQGKLEEADSSFRRAAELDPRAVEYLVDLALTEFQGRNYADAERVLERAAALAPDSPNVYDLRIVLYLNWEGNLEKPRRLLQEALTRFEFAGFATTQIFGDCIDLLAADDAYQAEVARLTPAAFNTRIDYYGFKAVVYHRRGETARATAYADTLRAEALAAIQRGEATYAVYDYLALANAYLGRAREAIAAGEQAQRILPRSKDALFGVEPYVTLAQVYTVLGNADAAAAQLEQALVVPSYLSPARLRADPLWAPLKGNPRFQRLIAAK